MLIHIFALRWNGDATPAQKEKAVAEVRAFQGKIQGIRELHVGSNLSPRSQGYETVGILHFDDAPALEAYLQHPVHQAFVESILPYVEAVDLDLQV